MKSGGLEVLLILGRTIQLGRLAQALALGLVVLCGALLIACADGQDTPTTQGATPTATAAVAPTNPQPTQEPTRPEPTPTGSSTAGPSQSDSPVKVVTSTNFVGDWARIVGGDRAEVFAMLPPGQDPHSFSPGGRDVAKVADADVVFTIGLSLEAEWLYDLLRNASADESKLIALGEFVDPIESTGPDPHGHGGDDHGETMSADGHAGEEVMGRLRSRREEGKFRNRPGNGRGGPGPLRSRIPGLAGFIRPRRRYGNRRFP